MRVGFWAHEALPAAAGSPGSKKTSNFIYQKILRRPKFGFGIKTRREIHGHRQELHLRRKLLMNRQKLDYFERSDLDRYLEKHPKLNELYRFKERLSQFYRTKGFARASIALENIIKTAKSSEYLEIKRLGETLNEWRKQILNYFKYNYTNAFTEAMNAIAKLVQRRGCGYRNFKNYRLRTLSACPL